MLLCLYLQPVHRRLEMPDLRLGSIAQLIPETALIIQNAVLQPVVLALLAPVLEMAEPGVPRHQAGGKRRALVGVVVI